MMNRRQFLWTSGAAAGAWAFGGKPGFAQSRQPAPNIVFILIDDFGWRDVSYMGTRYYETPHIDRLARQGMIFTNAYANAPNCAPSRACILSGQYTPRHGVYTVGASERGRSQDRKLIPIQNTTYLNPAIVTLAESLRQGGYRTAHFGKWHLGGGESDPLKQGFDVYLSGGEFGAPRRYFKQTEQGENDESAYVTDYLTDRAVEFIQANRDCPFFLNLWHYSVHTPLEARRHLIEKYKNKPPDGTHRHPVYAAMVESMDTAIGRVLETLDRLRLAENTLVVFFSDNGGYGPATSMAPLRGAKGMLYEGGIRVPLVVRWPGRIERDSRCDVPVIGVDFYPTLLEIAGVEKPEQPMDGCSILPLLRRTGSLDREDLFWHFPAYLEAYHTDIGPWRTTPAGAIRSGDFKLIEFFEDGRLELYHLDLDIGESVNLVDRYPAITERLHQRLKQWRTDLRAPAPVETNPEYIPYAIHKS